MKNLEKLSKKELISRINLLEENLTYHYESYIEEHKRYKNKPYYDSWAEHKAEALKDCCETMFLSLHDIPKIEYFDGNPKIKRFDFSINADHEIILTERARDE